METIG